MVSDGWPRDRRHGRLPRRHLLLAFGLSTPLSSEENEQERLDLLAQMHSAGSLLLGLSISLDELAIGFALGLRGTAILRG